MQWVYHVVDVFTDRPLEGNPLAVFPDAQGLSAETMQRIARELNLSETTFVIAPSTIDAAAHVRIFTPAYEMRFAGHPTLGTAYVLQKIGRIDPSATHFNLEEKVGLVPIRVDAAEKMIWLQTPPITFAELFDGELVAKAIGVDSAAILEAMPCQLVSAGNPLIFIALRDKAAVDEASVDLAAFNQLVAARAEPTCLFVFAITPQGAYSRMFCHELGVVEDPATGSATGPLAAFMMKYGLCPTSDGTRLISEQGVKMGRRSVLHVLVHGERGAGGIEIGGRVAPFAIATMDLGPGARE